jgi:hypothetical protein
MKIFNMILVMLDTVFDTFFDSDAWRSFVVDEVVAVLRVEVLAAIRLTIVFLDGLHFNAVFVLGCCFNCGQSLRMSGYQKESQTTDK